MRLSTGAVTTFLPKVESTQKPPTGEHRQEHHEEQAQASGTQAHDTGDGSRDSCRWQSSWRPPGKMARRQPATAGSPRHRRDR